MVQRWIFVFTCYCLTGCSSTERLSSKSNDSNIIPFRTIGQKIPVIEARLNNRPAWFIVDTGASITLLNATERINFDVAIHNTSHNLKKLSGFSDMIDVTLTSICRIEIGNLVIHHKVYISQEMDRLFSMIEKQEGISIAGILGSDILARYLMNVNYGTRTLSYIIK